MANILVCDDDEMMTMLLKIQIEEAGHHCYTVNLAKEAFFEASRSNYDLIITDIEMDQWSGYDLISALNQKQDSKIIIITGYDYSEIDPKLNDNPSICGILNKPFKTHQIIGMINQHTAA